MKRLTRAERLLWRAFPSGSWVELGDPVGARRTTAGGNAPREGHSWGPERTVRAEVIAALLLGAREADAGGIPAVRLRGARIVGALDLRGGTVEHELSLSGCHLDEPVVLTGCVTRTIRLTDCRLPALIASGLRAGGHLSLSGSHVTGVVQLPRAQLGDGLWLAGTKIDGDGEWALVGNAMVVDMGMLAMNAHFTGGVRLAGARLNGGLLMEGARLHNPGKDALVADSMVVEDVMRCTDGFLAEGCVRLRGARFNGSLRIEGVLRSPDTRYALHAGHIEAREVVLRPAEAVDGMVTFAYSRVETFEDDPARWPEKLRLNGLVYERLRGGAVARRISWAGRDPDGFRPQPYEQLAAWYLRDGNDALARRTQLAKLRAMRRHRGGLGGRLTGLLLDVTVGYGYRPWLAAMWFAALLGAGTAVFAAHPPRAIKPSESPAFEPFAYAFDLLLPVSVFGQRDHFDPAGWTQGFAYGLIVMGWVLATALIAGGTRVLRPN
ncbi:hypothetical protein [Thermoactinospora rubra]|uniref:hypothetical protein n=1 Tax=Thermoactinospora rubra TaxID=1088767 RepID=UPI001F0B686E|nr:hypothetical protein [Thermoactinospora rubra]